MEKFKRVFVIVVDSFGAGNGKDAKDYGDQGADTMGHIADSVDHWEIPNLQRLGLANLHPLKGVGPVSQPAGYYTVMNEESCGKDTMTGHWELMGIKTVKPFVTFTETGFPRELIEELEKRTGHKVIGNKSSSGTEILDELAEETRKRACHRADRGADFADRLPDGDDLLLLHGGGEGGAPGKPAADLPGSLHESSEFFLRAAAEDGHPHPDPRVSGQL